jgi:UDP-2,3-diacylglucosamine pyrophosphatase LpxH
MLLAFTSDLHTDTHAANRQVWQEMVAILRDVQPDVFICCGDVAADAQQFGVTLFALEHLPGAKLFVPGNHDVWIQNRAWVQRGITSAQKYYQLLPALCRAAGVHPLWLEPYVHEDIAFCGSMGWYDYSLRNPIFDQEISRQDYRRKHFQDRLWNDRRFVIWPAAHTEPTQALCLSDEALTAHLVSEFAQQLQRGQQLARRIVAVTHMLPFRAMMQYHQEARWDYFGAFMGSTLLGDLLQSCPEVHLVLAGHTHRKMSLHVGRIAIHTSPLGYARQWQELTPLAVAREHLRFLHLD